MAANEGSSTFDPRFEEAMESFLGRLRQGEQPAIDEYQERYPELAKKIGDVFPGLLMIEGMRL